MLHSQTYPKPRHESLLDFSPFIPPSIQPKQPKRSLFSKLFHKKPKSIASPRSCYIKHYSMTEQPIPNYMIFHEQPHLRQVADRHLRQVASVDRPHLRQVASVDRPHLRPVESRVYHHCMDLNGFGYSSHSLLDHLCTKNIHYHQGKIHHKSHKRRRRIKQLKRQLNCHKRKPKKHPKFIVNWNYAQQTISIHQEIKQIEEMVKNNPDSFMVEQEDHSACSGHEPEIVCKKKTIKEKLVKLLKRRKKEQGSPSSIQSEHYTSIHSTPSSIHSIPSNEHSIHFDINSTHSTSIPSNIEINACIQSNQRSTLSTILEEEEEEEEEPIKKFNARTTSLPCEVAVETIFKKLSMQVVPEESNSSFAVDFQNLYTKH